MDKVTVSSKGQIAIPKQVREALNLTEGSKLTLEVRGHDIVLSKDPAWKKLQGAGRDIKKDFRSSEKRSANLKIRVLDSWPVLEWIKGTQPVTDIVADLLVDSGSGIARLLMSANNVGEVYYFVRKYHGEALAESWRQSSGTLPITIEVPTADEIWDAALLKARYPKIG